MKPTARSFSILLATLATVAETGRGQPVVPTDGMVITSDTTFVPGTYALPNGVSIGASGVTLDLNGAMLTGTNLAQYGVTCLGFDDVGIKNGVVANYYYGIRVENGAGISVLNNDLSYNWVDPLSLTPAAPFLNINAGPTLPNPTNLGGGMYLRDISESMISGNTLTHQENGIDCYMVNSSTLSGNNASDNTGWGIHLYGSTGNVVSSNVADRCTRSGLGDSAGFLVVFGSSGNEFLNNFFRQSGDGFFIGNENGCPSNNNFVYGNDGSLAGANAFEATFSSGNQFINNIADSSNYGFWLGYSHSGNAIIGNSVRGNNVNGIEIEHGQLNIIENNEIIGNGGKGIVLRTDNLVHFPPGQFPCLALPNQAASSSYSVRGNIIENNFGKGLELINTTGSMIDDNVFSGNLGGTATASGAGNVWSIAPTPGRNSVGGPTLGGNYWSNYTGTDTDGDGLGDTDVPYTNGGLIAPPGDPHPLIGNPPVNPFDNPRTLCDRAWQDLGPNTRSNGQVFNTANGTHLATDGGELLLLEGNNSTLHDHYNAVTNHYEPKAVIPEGVQDGGDYQFGGGFYFATVGVGFNPNTGAGNGPRLYAYDPRNNTWAARAPTMINGKLVGNEALAYDPLGALLYATIVAVLSPAAGGDVTLLKKLAVYDPANDVWTGATSAGPVSFAPGTEAEYLDGKVYVWRGGFNGGAVNGADSLLYVYDIATDAWSQTPSLQSAGVIPGFRSGAFDVWGVALAADPARKQVFVLGAETNHQLYVFDVASQTWAVGPAAVYDGGWGDALEYVTATNRLYQIDGRNALNTPQGTAVMVSAPGDANVDGQVDLADLVQFDSCLGGPGVTTPAGCQLMDFACDDDVDVADFAAFQAVFAGR